MKKANILVFLCSLLSLASCQSTKGRINFVLNGGEFVSPSFSTDYLEGPAGEKIQVDIPDAKKDGYYFVGWQEKDKNGKYRAIDKRRDPQGTESYYFYPYGTTTLYAYFEPLASFSFDLTTGKEKGASLVAPVNDAKSFSGNRLNGYTSKPITDTSYLPTVSCPEESHLTFDYWYTKYPLIASEDENKITHYSLDKTKPEGVYPFTSSFGDEKRQFPEREGNNRTLYASYISDPTITLHYGIEGREDESFQGKNSIETKLKEIMSEKFSFDYSTEHLQFYYPSDSKKYRFAGFFLDKELTEPFYRDSPIGSVSFDLYLKWDNKITLTIDYDGGKVDGKEKETIDTYYSEDILGKTFKESHAPIKTNAHFKGFTLDGEDFDVVYDPLPRGKEELTLLAVYDSYPLLTLSIDYPTDFPEAERLPREKIPVKENDNLSSYLESFAKKSAKTITDHHLYAKGYYLLQNGKEVAFTSSVRPNNDLALTYVLDYLGKRTIKSSYNPSDSYISRGETEDRVAYGSFKTDKDTGEVGPSLFEEASFPSLKKAYEKDGNTYLYDGLYLDEAMTNPFAFPHVRNTGHEKREEITIYRKRTKAITITIKDYNNQEKILVDSLKVVPSSLISDYASDLPSYKALYVNEAGKRIPLSLRWPDASMTVYLLA